MQDSANSNFSSRVLWPAGLSCLPAILAILHFFPLQTLNIAGLAAMVLGLSWCLYQYFVPLHLIRRRALLEHITSAHSVLRRWLWNGLWSKLLLFCWSVVLALGVLVLSSGFSQAEWWWLLACVPILLLLVPVGIRMTGSEASGGYQLALGLRVAVYLTIAISTVGLIVLQLYGEGVADTRQLSLLQVVEQSWTDANRSATTGMVWTGWLLGVEAVMDNSIWHLMQQASALSEQSAALKLSAWLLFLLFIALRAAIIWFVLAGLLSWTLTLFTDKTRVPPLLQGGQSGRAFALGIILLASGSLLMSLPGVSGFVSLLADRSMQALPLPPPDPCVRQAPLELARLQQSTDQSMTAASLSLQTDLGARLDAELDRVFALAEPAVDAYLDWNFSLSGQYVQLAYLVQAALGGGSSGGGSNGGSGSSLSLEQRYSNYISQKIDDFVSPAMSPALLQASQDLQLQFNSQAQAFYLQQASFMEQLAASADCLRFEMPALSTPELVNKSAVGLGPAVGLVVTRLAARAGTGAGARIGSNVVARNATKRVVSTGAAKVATKTAQSTGASGIGLGCGPLAPVCMPVLFAATWLGTDLLLNEIDETLNRQAMRADLLAALDAEKNRLKTEYRDAWQAGMFQVLAELQNHQQQRFMILRDGV